MTNNRADSDRLAVHLKATAGRTDNMKSTADIFTNEEPTEEAIQRMLATCDDTSEYIKGNMINCKK